MLLPQMIQNVIAFIIKSLDQMSLKCFLQFTTGSDIITVSTVSISFTTLDCSLIMSLLKSLLVNNKEAWSFTIV